MRIICFTKQLKKDTFLLLYLFSLAAYGQEAATIFKSGDGGYQCFRIPAIVTTNQGTLLAFAEARKNGCGDAGDIDLVMRRSEDGVKAGLRCKWSGTMPITPVATRPP